jgi:hypothetical protein
VSVVAQQTTTQDFSLSADVGLSNLYLPIVLQK